jgi:hypothetical protein
VLIPKKSPAALFDFSTENAGWEIAADRPDTPRLFSRMGRLKELEWPLTSHPNPKGLT